MAPDLLTIAGAGAGRPESWQKGAFTSVLVLELTLVGVAFGALYSLAALGIVLIYKTTGVLNFAHGAIGMFAAFVAYQVGVVQQAPAILAVALALAFAAGFGWLMERFTLRPLRERPVLARVIVTLGWLLVLQAVAGLIWRDTSYHIPLQVSPRPACASRR
jgi:branched-subunit amino acid ABC-type transport system permease component